MQTITGTRAEDFEADAGEAGPSFEERLAEATNDYETLDAESAAGFGL